jgi:hypothetical protein
MRIAQLRQGDHQKEVAQLFPGKTISGGTWITIRKSGKTSLGKDFRPTVAFILEGGSISIAQSFKAVLNSNALLVGVVLPNAKVHSPNENFPLGNLEASIRLNQELLEEIAESSGAFSF